MCLSRQALLYPIPPQTAGPAQKTSKGLSAELQKRSHRPAASRPPLLPPPYRSCLHCDGPKEPRGLLSSVQSLSHVRLFTTPWTAARQASLSITSSQSLPKLKSVMTFNHLIFCRPLLLPSIFPSIRVFSNESALHIRWPKDWSFTFSVSPSSEHPGLISCRMDWLDLLAVQGTPKSLLQHHSSKASILSHSSFFIVQLSSIHDYWKYSLN